MNTITIDRAVVEQALEANGCERIRDFYAVGPVQRAAVESFAEALRAALEHPAEQSANTVGAVLQEPVVCPVCNEVHTILDADKSQIIRNAADGYPDGRASRVLTLQERVTALCIYAADWKRWCLEKENTPQPSKQPLTDGEIRQMWKEYAPIIGGVMDFARAIERAHGIGGKA